jgi:hypothetical protein
MDTYFHKYQVIDWEYIQNEMVMEGFISKFKACWLYELMGQKTDYNGMAVRQFLATAEIDIEEKTIICMTGFKRYDATFVKFVAANSLEHDLVSAGIDLYTKENFEKYVQYYEPARLEIARRFGETSGVRHHPAVINKIARVTILSKSGDKSNIRDKFWNVIHHVMNVEVMHVGRVSRYALGAVGVMLPSGVGGSSIRGRLLFSVSDPLVFSAVRGRMLSAKVTLPLLEARVAFVVSSEEELALVVTFSFIFSRKSPYM